jgi:hypothetical protein
VDAIGIEAPVTEMVSVDVPLPLRVAGLKLPVMTPRTPSTVEGYAVRVTGNSTPSTVRIWIVVVPVVVVVAPLPTAGILTGLGEAIS